MKVLVRSDVFNICERVKKFDSAYRVVYDNIANTYLIYSTNLNGGIELIGWTPLSYVCTLPYDCLDNRTIDYLYSTRVENLEDIIKQIDEDNQKLERDNQLKLKYQSIALAENKLRQLTR